MVRDVGWSLFLRFKGRYYIPVSGVASRSVQFLLMLFTNTVKDSRAHLLKITNQTDILRKIVSGFSLVRSQRSDSDLSGRAN